MATDTLDAVIGRVMYHEPSKWNPAGIPFLIARTTAGQTIKGEMLRPVEGEPYRFYGEWKPQKNRNGETAFEFHSYEAVIERSVGGQEQYLAAHVDGIGRVKAAALAEHFGPDTIDILSADPERAREVAGITDRIVDALRSHFEEQEKHKLDPRAVAKLMDLFARDGHRVSKKVIKLLVKDFGPNAPEIIQTNPYALIDYPGCGWKTVDAFGLTTAKYDPHGPERQRAALLEALNSVTDEGHTVAFRAEVEARAGRLLNYPPEPSAWAALVGEGKMVDLPGGRCADPRLHHAENEIKAMVADLSAAVGPLGFDLDASGLAADQVAALETVANHGVCALVGPPGTGKSYTVARIIRSFLAHGIRDIVVVAPTGKAAKRAAELLAGAKIDPETVPAMTVHKALAPAPSDEAAGVPAAHAKVGRGREAFRFAKGPDDPIDAQFVVVDETSMVDARLMMHLLSAIAPGTRVLFVGDQNQLPSVGPGSVLRDLIAGGLPTAELRDIKRSDGGGRVVRACHAIVAGREPEPAPVLAPPTENWLHIEENDPARIADVIVELHRHANKYDPLWGYQVVSAQKAKHPFACDNLNARLSDLLNPDPSGRATSDDPAAPPFRPGDKVIRTKNGLVAELFEAVPFDRPEWRWGGKEWTIGETPVVNGDMGTVRDIVIQGDKSFAVVEFRDPARLCRIPYGDHHLALAYAVTVHKAQGSGFPVVIVPCHTSFYFDQRSEQGLWCRELYYTAISRAEHILITVGQWAAVRQAIARPTVHVRRTRLAALLRGEDADAMPVPNFPPAGLSLGGPALNFDMESAS